MPTYGVPKAIYYLSGAGIAVGASVIWNYLPWHEAFVKSLQKSPLAFLEHYHWGLASLIAGRTIKNYAAVFDGFGLTMIASEVVTPNPFGIGKSPEEVAGNLTLTYILSGLLLFKLGS